ncbi:MAG: GNAT family N-acetyltransferase [Nitrospirae bacterium]|nr:GNAT family N-acetyltransferase [Nitrospirota bacterium]
MAEEDVLKFIAANGEKIVLRLAGCEDAEEIISVIKTNAPDRSYVLMEMYGTKPDSVKKYICSMNFDKNLLLVALANKTVVGALSGIQMDEGKRPHTAHILNIGLHIVTAYRGLGIGSQMLRFAIDWAKRHGFKKLEANIFTTNKKSLHVFERAEFIEEGTRQKRIRIGKQYIDEVLVGKVL